MASAVDQNPSPATGGDAMKVEVRLALSLAAAKSDVAARWLQGTGNQTQTQASIADAQQGDNTQTPEQQTQPVSRVSGQKDVQVAHQVSFVKHGFGHVLARATQG